MSTRSSDVIEFLKKQSDTEMLIDLRTLKSSEVDAKLVKIIQALESLIDSPIKSVVIEDDTLTVDQANQILSFLQKPEQALFGVSITLPKQLENTRIQIELDHLISNHRLEKNIQLMNSTHSTAQTTIKPTVEGRKLPKGKIRPKIEITLNEEVTSETVSTSTITIDNTSTFKDPDQLPRLARSPMAEKFVAEILALPGYQNAQTNWKQCTDRSKDREMRESALLTAAILEEHPLRHLLRTDAELQKTLANWTATLNLGIDQYHALLDIYGQYGTIGLINLFKTWEGYSNNGPHKKAAFEETHALLLKHMPSYLPFLEHTAFNDIISKISNLSTEKRSWWMALIKNHGINKGYSDLPGLFNYFIEASVAIEEMGLTFYNIDAIKDTRDLPSVLSDMLALLKKCPAQDKREQWQSLSRVNVSRQKEFHFIIPEMEVEQSKIPTLEAMKALFSNSEPESIKPAFYQYLATQKQHLPLEEYRQFLDDLFADKKLTKETKLKMAYLLAKTTSTESDTGFDSKLVIEEWKSYKERTVGLAYIDRVKANGGTLITIVLNAVGDAVIRNETIDPLMNMPITPPMSYLNKLLKISEYGFLDITLSKTGLKKLKDEMPKRIEEAAVLYQKHPAAMMQAIRLIKTETVKVNSAGKFPAEPQDIRLLEQFIIASETMIAPANNILNTPELNPHNVLLPLLTTFHLEYESKDNLVNEVIKPYEIRINGDKNPGYQEKIQSLFPYGLSLLQLIKNRQQPDRLDFKTFNRIQDELLVLICQPTTGKKQIREWMHKNYGQYFDGTVLLDMRDEVSFNKLFDTLECTQKETRQNIELLVSNFDSTDEKLQHDQLVTSLVRLEKRLTPLQKKHFFEYCDEAFKTNGLLSRDKHPGPPSYISQFRSLVDTMTSLKSIDEFERYMTTAKELISKQVDEKDSLAKCNYLLSTLYPALIQKGVARKEALNFAVELVCRTPLNALDMCHVQVKFTSVEEARELTALSLEIRAFNQLTVKSTEALVKLKEKIDAIINLCPNDTTCQNIKTVIIELTKAIETRTAEHKNKGFFSKLFGGFTPAISEAELTKLKAAGLSEELAASPSPTYVSVNAIAHQKRASFQNIVTHLHERKTRLLEQYSNLAIRANDFIAKALILSPNDVSKNHNDTCQLINNLLALDNQNLVLSLMYHFAGGLPDRGVNDLIELFNTPEYQGLTSELKKECINAIITQMNNGVTCNKTDINAFLSFIHEQQDNALIKQCLHNYYQHAPFPQLTTFMFWTKELKTQEEIQKVYKHFDKNPCAILDKHDGREKDNGFKIDLAKKIVEKMPEVQNILTSDYLFEIESAAKLAKHLSTQEILDRLKKFKDNKPSNHITMVMLSAELLHRCKGRTPLFVVETQMMGRSYELNTTQIIAILSMLETGKKVTAEIGTGEGKSRIMMILNACQFLKGNTVDFVTSNIALAERDYLESLPFFNSLGAEVNFITASSKIEDYKIGGINVSDPANLCLFRNKAFSQKKSHLVLNPNPEQRSLLLDEADVTYFDVSNTQYNSSSTPSQSAMDLLPLYPLLMEFFAQKDTEKTYFENKQRCNEQLLAFLEARNPSLFKIVKSKPMTQLEKWQKAAYVARHLEYNTHYAIAADATAPTAFGDKKVAAAMCLVGSRINKNAQFSESVHQCLHAELNRLMKTPMTAATNTYLKEALDKCKSKERVFNIEPERPINYSSTSNTMIKAYDQGNLYAVTGTIGSDIEQREAKSHFGSKFVHVPRHKGMRRIDRPTRITENEATHLDALVTHILESRAKQQPVLLICKDDNESRMVYDLLNKRLEQRRDAAGLPKLARIHATTDYEDNTSEAKYLKEEAGKPGQVTITTEMEGRGVDIELKDKAHQAGLKVLLTYLPQGERDYGQIIGRSGRYGAIGETQMVLNLQTLKSDFGINHLNADFYINPETFIRRLQMFSTHTKELHRLFHRAYDNFLEGFTKRYESLNTKESNLSAAWSQFLEQYQISKDTIHQDIEAQLEQSRPDLELINKKLNEHRQTVKKHWHIFAEHLAPDQKDKQQKAFIPVVQKPELLVQWLDEMKTLQNDHEDVITVEETHEVSVREHYDPAFAGHTHILKNPGFFKTEGREWFANTRAWLRGEGILFANLRTWWAGEMSFRNLLSQIPILSWFISPKSETKVVQIEIPSTHATLYKKFPDITETEEPREDNPSAEMIALEVNPTHHQSPIGAEERPRPETEKTEESHGLTA